MVNGRPKFSYTTQQHQDVSLFDSELPEPAPAGRELPSAQFLSPSRATPAKALNREFPPDLAPKKSPAKKLKADPADLSIEKHWLALRNQAVKPRHLSEMVTTQQDRDEFLAGARLLRYYGTTAKPGHRPQPQQLVVADVLAAGHKRTGLLLPRRSGKSTSAITVGIGRAATREDYRVGILTLTSGKAGRSRFLKDVVPPIERLYPDKAERPFKLIKIAGMEGLSWPTGGSITWLSTLDDVRGEAFDLLILDEAGEPNDPDFVEEVIGAALPTLDTRPGAQLVAQGTAGRFRAGNLLWDALELGRKGHGGIVEYSMPDSTTMEELAAWEPTEENPDGHVRELVELSHPGVGTLTTLESIRENYVTMTGNGAKTEKFAREYGGIFGDLGNTAGIFDVVKWTEHGTGSEPPSPPERFGLAIVTHPDQLSASIVAAWRDPKGRAVALLLDNQRGVEWLAKRSLELSRKYQTPLTYDTGSQVVLVTVETLTRARPRPRLDPRTFVDVKKAAALVVDEIARGNITHYRQPDLTNAITITVKRKIGPNAWALGRPTNDPNADITPAEGFALALLAYDESKPRTRTRSRVQT